MLKKILIALVGIIALLAVVIALRPAQFRISRSTTISAAPATVFPLINNFRNWDGWSPWAKIDPEMKKSIEGAPAGVGSIYTWSGNNDVGEGRMTILESDPNERVRIRLEFMRPFASTNMTEFTLKPEGPGTSVNWDMSGENNFMSKAFDLFMNMDKTVGADFEKGLAQMKTTAEQQAQRP
jgi:uncharacterized protein YndB with AHSA1/START domain